LIEGNAGSRDSPDAKERSLTMIRKLLLAQFLLAATIALAASQAAAGEAVPETIYNPNVSFPSYGAVQALRFLQPDYGFKEELHLGQSWSRLFDNRAVPEGQEGGD
jgi:hypothetical protein